MQLNKLMKYDGSWSTNVSDWFIVAIGNDERVLNKGL